MTTQLERVETYMRDGAWHTLEEIAGSIGEGTQSVSARLRDLRKDQFGGHVVERHYLCKGLATYRLDHGAGARP